MASKFNFSNFFGLDTASEETPEQQKGVGNNVIPITREGINNINQSNIEIVQPKTYAEIETIGKKLMDDSAVIVKLDKLDVESSARMIDFLNGVLFAIHGKIERLGQDIFLCSPKKFNITNSDS